MRLSIYVTTLSCLLVACGGSGGQDPILGIPTVTTSPRVILTTPAKLVPIVSGVATNTRLTAKFNRDMLASSLNASSFTVTCLSGGAVTSTVTYDATTRLATLQHANVFASNTTCEARVSTAAKDASGIALANDYVWSFATSAVIDDTPPTIVARNPADPTLSICKNHSVSVTFSESMDPTTITAANMYVTGGVNPTEAGALTYDTLSKTATFTVSDPAGFANTTTYTVHVNTGVQDLAGVAMAIDSTSTFQTNTALCAAAPTVSLGAVAAFGAFGGGAGATNSGLNTVVNGDLGTTAACTLFTGFHDGSHVYTQTTSNVGEVTGDIFCGPPAPGTTQKLAIATQAAADALAAYNALAAMPLATRLSSGDLHGVPSLTLAPGIYRPSDATLQLSTGNITLDASGDANAMWVFQIPESLTMALDTKVLLANGAQAKNVYWQVGSAARLENRSTMVGTIIARAGVTISTAAEPLQTTLTGRAIGLNASVTMVNTTIVAP
jgi:hypothetical protein